METSLFERYPLTCRRRRIRPIAASAGCRVHKVVSVAIVFSYRTVFYRA